MGSRPDHGCPYALPFLASGLTGPFVGRIVDRYGPQKVIATGGLVGAMGYMTCRPGKRGLAVLRELHHKRVSPWRGSGTVPTTAVISKWFKKRRGTAIGIMSAGVGAGGLVMSPLLGGYVIPIFGWRMGFLSWPLLWPRLFLSPFWSSRQSLRTWGFTPTGTGIHQRQVKREQETRF